MGRCTPRRLAYWRLGVGFLVVVFALPVARVFITAFLDSDNSLTLGHFSAFFSQDLMRESFMNSLYVAVMSALLLH